MSCTIEHRRFYCTTSEVSFGPLFESHEEGEEFRSWVYRTHGDPRLFSLDQLQTWLDAWRTPGHLVTEPETCDGERAI